MALNQLDGYLQSDTDTASTSIQYFGYLSGNSAYYILRSSTSANVSAFRYYASAGLTNYQTDWTNRAGLNYDYYSNVFPNS